MDRRDSVPNQLYLSSRKWKNTKGSYSSLASGSSSYSADAREMLASKRKFQEVDSNLDQEMREIEIERLRKLKDRRYLMAMENEIRAMDALRSSSLLKSDIMPRGVPTDVEHGSEGSASSPVLRSGDYIRGYPMMTALSRPSSSLSLYAAPRNELVTSRNSLVESEFDLASELDFYDAKMRTDFAGSAVSKQADDTLRRAGMGGLEVELPVEEYVEYKVKENSTNMGFKKLFGEFLYREMDFVYIYDPTYLFPYHINNLAMFIHLLRETTKVKRVMLETSPRTATKSQVLIELKNLQKSLKSLGIHFEFFCVKLDLDKKAWISFGRKWKVSLDRGLDIFKAPESALDKQNMELRRTHAFSLFAVKYDMNVY